MLFDRVRLNFYDFHANSLFGVVIPQSHLFLTKAPMLSRAEVNSGLEANTSGITAQASTAVDQEGTLDWAKKDNRRMLHVVYRVGDLDRTIK